jgi:hypothetical protein
MSEPEIRGVMLDSARLTERRGTYRDTIALLGDWGYNAIFWHFTDDEGCVCRFPSHPELAGLHAYSVEDTKRLVKYAKQHGLQIIPEVECMGHTGYITGKRRYAHLRDGAPGMRYGSIAAFDPESRSILKNILEDTASIFPAPYIHVGMDEVAFGSHISSESLLKTKKKWELIVEYICWLHGIVTGLGKTMMIWGDHLLPKEIRYDYPGLDTEAMNPNIVDRIPGDIVICDWHYNADVKPDSLDFFLERGFRVLAFPALSASPMFGHPRICNLQNIRRFSRMAAQRAAQGVLGVVVCGWTPYRNLPGSMLAGFRLGSEWIRGSDQEPGRQAYRKFVEDTFGLGDPMPAAEAIDLLHNAVPPSELLYKVTPRNDDEIADLSSEELRRLDESAEALQLAETLLRRSRTYVKSRAVYYDDLLETAICIRMLCRRGRFWKEIVRIWQRNMEERKTGRAMPAGNDAKAVRSVLREEARHAQALYRRMVSQWNRTRYADDPKRDGVKKADIFHDALLQRLRMSAMVLISIEQSVDDMS